jgi:hypothetical protein
LPDVQRGFIWKPSQIENLWDSLLRCFPAGSIITNKMKDEKYQLLDGQQRTTSIALGFADLKGEGEKCKVLNASIKNYRIFIDTRKPARDKEGRHFAFRVITYSHPWGYQHVDNTKPLTANNKAAAMKLWEERWGIKDPFEEEVLGKAYPYDAYAPLPLNIFTRIALKEASGEFEKEKALNELKRELAEWLKEKTGGRVDSSDITTWLFKLKYPNKEELPDTYSIEFIYQKIQEMLEHYLIPMLPLYKNLLQEDVGDTEANSQSDLSVDPDPDSDENEIEESDDDENAYEEHDDVEEVFVRLNSGGTPLSGEELNYSIIKGKMEVDTGLRKAIEGACTGIMKPSRFITLAYRLYQKKKGDDAIDLRIKPKQFQRDMKSNDEFLAFIKEDILKTGLLKKVTNILKIKEDMEGYNDSYSDSDYRLPYPLFIRVAATGQGEIMFMLMYRLWRGDTFEYGSPLHRQMVGIILMFMWHGKDARSRYDKLLRKIWEEVKTLPCEQMWSKEIIAVAQDDDGVLKGIPKNVNFFSVIETPLIKTTKIWNNYQKGEYREFFDNVMRNKELLLWIQRRFLSKDKYFNEKLFRLDDTDVPFDWDHISPDNYIRNKHGVAFPLKHIYQEPANLRAWPYKLNRSDGSTPPASKLSGNYFTNSFCKQHWSKFDQTWLDGKKIQEDYWKDVYMLILDRWKEMYKELAKELLINKL